MRGSARILLFDLEGDRILLFLNHGAPDEEPWWITPGGGIEHDESPAQAAQRELFEETGIALDTEVMEELKILERRTHHVYRHRQAVHFEHYFYVEVAGHQRLDFSRFTAAENSVITTHRWWTTSELRTARETIWPSNLPEILTLAHTGSLDIPERPAGAFDGIDLTPSLTQRRAGLQRHTFN